MSLIQQLEHSMREKYPQATIELDPSQTETGWWFLDINIENQTQVAIIWCPEHGKFGLTIKGDFKDFMPFSGHDESYDTLDAVQARIIHCLDHGEFTADSTP